MKKRTIQKLICFACFFTAFVIWTIFVCVWDVNAIGPNGSSVGLAKMNAYFHELTGVNMLLYTITDWLGMIPLLFVLGFAILGCIQWISRKSIKKVDGNLLLLGGFYLLIFFVFIFFEIVVINYRPILIAGVLEASYPSSTTMLSLCVMLTSTIQIKQRLKSPTLCYFITVGLLSFAFLMVIGRLISGVHWFSDIIGGILLSAALVFLYKFVISLMK